MRLFRTPRFYMAWLIWLSITGSVWSATEDILGDWMGTLDVPGVDIQIAFTIQEDQEGALSAELHVPNQVIFDIPFDEVHFEDDRLTLVSEAVQASYEGQLIVGRRSARLQGHWREGNATVRLDLYPVDEVPRPHRPQTPQPPFPYLEQEVVFENVDAGVQLAGTLTLPEGPGPNPVLVLISGSGAQNRNSTFFEHKPFWVLADYLTRLGLAVLRYDDRGVGGSTLGETEATTADQAGDVIAAVSFLIEHPDIDPNRIGLIGHSEGGIIAPMVANQIESIGLIVSLAGPGLPGSQILLYQNEDIFRAQGFSESDIETRLTYLHRVFEILEAYPDDTMAQAKIKEAIRQIAGSGDPEAELNREAELWTSPWMRFFVSYDPGPALAQLTSSILVLVGDLDIQVRATQNLPVIETILQQAGHPDYLVLELPGLNHLFQTAQTGTVGEYALIEETFSLDALELIGEWILARFWVDSANP